MPDYVPAEVPASPPRPAKPAHVAFIAFPGGEISVDGKAAGIDVTRTLVLKPGSHTVVVVNRFLGEHTTTIELGDGQTGVVTIEW